MTGPDTGSELLPEETTSPSPFERVVKQFVDTLDGIRDLIETLPLVSVMDRPELVLRRQLGHLPEKQRNRAGEALRNLIEGIRDTGNVSIEFLPPSDDSAAPELRPSVRRVPGNSGSDATATPEETHQRIGDAVVALVEATGDVTATLHLLRGLIARKGRQPRAKLMTRSLVPVAVGALDVLLAGLIREFSRRFPDALWDPGQTTMSIEELKSFDSVVAALEAAADRRIDELLRLSLDELALTLRRRLKLEPEPLALDWQALREVVERRHVTVHHGGRVSRQYVAKVRTDLAIGAELPVDSAYIARAVDELMVFGTMLSLQLWERAFRTEDEERTSLLTRNPGIVYDLMLEGRWEAVEAICLKSSELQLDDSSRDVLRVNRWLAEKRLGRLTREEVTSWKPVGMAYRLAQLTLLDQLDQAVVLVEPCVSEGELEPKDLTEWPILAELRALPDYQMLLGRAKAAWTRRTATAQRRKSATQELH